MANRDLQAELELYKEAFFTKDNSKLFEFYKPLFRSVMWSSTPSDTLYVFACKFGNCHAISLLYELGDQTYNKSSSIGSSPLYLAVSYDNKECVQTLLEIPEYQLNDKNIFRHIDRVRDNTVIETVVEAAFRRHTIDYFEYYKKYNPKMSHIMCVACGDQQGNINEDYVLGVRYRVFFNRSLTSRLLLKS
jgi:hypothetical protein